jgi:hypothetical protein
MWPKMVQLVRRGVWVHAQAVVSVQAIIRLLIVVLSNEPGAKLGCCDIKLLDRACHENVNHRGDAGDLRCKEFARLTGDPAALSIASRGIWPPLLLRPFHEGTLSPVGRAEGTGWANINLARHLSLPAEVAWPVLPRLVRPRTGHRGSQL